MDNNSKLIFQIIILLLLLASISSFIYGIVVLIQYFQLKNELSHNPKERTEKKINKLNHMKPSFLATIVIGLWFNRYVYIFSSIKYIIFTYCKYIIIY